MKINCINTGKRFNRDWVFRRFTYEFTKGNFYAITGPNGSGKSTLLQVIASAMVSSEGTVTYELKNKQLNPDEVFTCVSLAAPYIELVEEMTLTEFFHFHRIFKPFLPGASIELIIQTIGLQMAAEKQIRNYSSGMKQRVKLAQAIFSDTPCLLLDEPCTNLDTSGIEIYHQLIEQFCTNRLVIVSSNDVQEYSFCNHILAISNFK